MKTKFLFFIMSLMCFSLIAQNISPPENLQAIQGTAVIVLTWSPVVPETSQSIGYKVYRNGIVIAGERESLTRPTFTDTTALPAITYVYFVTSVDIASNEESQPSNVAVAEALAPNIETRETNTPTVIQSESPLVTARNTQRNQTRDTNQSFDTKWMFSMVGLYSLHNHSYGYGHNDYGYEYRLETDNYSLFPEIQLRVNTDTPFAFDVGARLYFTRSESFFYWGTPGEIGISDVKDEWVYSGNYGEIYSQIRFDFGVVEDNAGAFITPYIEPRFLIDQDFKSFLVYGLDFSLGAIDIYSQSELLGRIYFGLLMEAGDIDNFQFRIGGDLGFAKGVSVSPRFIFRHRSSNTRFQFQLSVGYTI